MTEKIKMVRYALIITLMLLAFCLPSSAQQITGYITDAETGDSIPFVSVVYKGHSMAAVSDTAGHYSIIRRNGWKLSFSAVGYKATVVPINSQTKSPLNIVLTPDKQQLAEVTVKAKRNRYSRKDNPAVELMKKVIAAKKESNLANHDYYKYNKYEKLTLAANDLSPQMLQEKPFSSTPWLMDQVEVCKYNLKMILPLSVDETVSEIVYRKNPQSKKTYIKGQQLYIKDVFGF